MFGFAGFGVGKKTREEEDKKNQFKELRAAFPNIRRPNNDDSFFELIIPGASGQIR